MIVQCYLALGMHVYGRTGGNGSRLHWIVRILNIGHGRKYACSLVFHLST